MKRNKLLLSLFTALTIIIICTSLVSYSFSSLDKESNLVDFLYIHGVSIYDDIEMKKFNGSAQRLHSSLAHRFQKSKKAQKSFLEDDTLKINPEAKTFFWGNLVKKDVDTINSRLNSVTPLDKLVGKIHHIGSTAMYVGFWLGKNHNRNIVNEKLHKQLEGHEEDKKLVIMGHSAGSIVAYFYLLYRLPYLDLYSRANRNNFSSSLLKTLSQKEHRYSCVQALLESKVARFDKQGKLVLFTENVEIKNKGLLEEFNQQFLKEKVSNIDQYNKKFCLPRNKLKGIVTFGSPLVGIVSKSQDSEGVDLTQKLFKYIVKNEIFWLHVNHKDDPIGFPVDDEKITQLHL